MPRAKKPKKPIESPRLPTAFDRQLLQQAKRSYVRSPIAGTWTEESVNAAVDAQILGQFRQPVMLARALLKEPAIYTASANRLAPHRGLRRDISCKTKLTGTAASILEEARSCFAAPSSVALSPGVIAEDFDRIAMHGISVDQVYWLPRCGCGGGPCIRLSPECGTRLDPFVEPWPLEYVQWFDVPPDGTASGVDGGDCGGLFALTTEGYVRIVHGNGRWIVASLHADRPWRRGALVALAGLWVDLRFGRRDRSRSAESHGDDKWFAELPPNIMPEDPNGQITLEQLAAMYDPRHAAVFASGTKVTRSEAMSQNWQIFKELLESGAKDASLVTLGQDGTTTNSSQRLTFAQLFGVRDDVVEGDLAAENASINTGLLRPWSMVNFGRWDHLEHAWIKPDADEDARLESVAMRTDAFNRSVKEYRENGMQIDQAFVDALAADYGVRAPKIAESPAAAPAVPGTNSDAAPAIVAHRSPLRAAG